MKTFKKSSSYVYFVLAVVVIVGFSLFLSHVANAVPIVDLTSSISIDNQFPVPNATVKLSGKITLTSSGANGQTFTFDNKIYRGPSPTGPWTPQYDLGNMDLIAGSNPVKGTYSYQWAVGSVDGVDYYFKICADDNNNCINPTGTVGESDEANNEAIIGPLRITTAPTPPIDPVNVSGWAWSSNIGHISFNCAQVGYQSTCGTNPYKVQMDNDADATKNGNLSGYAWSQNIGWIAFDNTQTAVCSAAHGGGRAKVSTTITNDTSAVTGWAVALSGKGHASDGWDGCIRLSSPNPPDPSHPSPDSSGPNGESLKGVTLKRSTGAFSGYAWGQDVMGWIDFNPHTPGWVSGFGLPPPTGGGNCNPPSACPGVATAIPNNTPTCDISVPVEANNSVSITWTLNNQPAGNYTLRRITLQNDLKTDISQSPSQKSLTDNGFTVSTKYSIFKTLDPSIPVLPCTSSTVNYSTGGLKLLIGGKASSLAAQSNLYNHDTGYNYMTVVKGRPFGMRWNVNLPPGGGSNWSCSLTMGSNSAVNQVSIDPQWNIWQVKVPDTTGSDNGGETDLNTKLESLGLHTFRIKCTDLNGILPDKKDYVDLNVTAPTVEEF